MERFPSSLLRRLPLVGLLLAACLGSLAPAAGAAEPLAPVDPARELARTAEPLTDLRPLDRMIGSAKVVGIGEATHSSAEFFTTKHRVFEHLVESRGFTTFALEANWSTGLLVDEWVRTGRGDIRAIMRDEFQESYRLWNTEEYLDLFRWMRRHNQRHPDHPVRFMGNDLGYAGANVFDEVTAYVARTRPALLPRVRELYRDSRPTGGVESWMKGYMARPRAERQRMAADVNTALALLERRPPATRDPRAREAAQWAVQHARAIAQVGTEYAHDLETPAGVAAAMLYRDRTMADNTVWWQRHTGDRIVLSAHNGHVGYETPKADQYPRIQGAFLRDALGRDYVSVGTSFGRGSFRAHDTEAPGEPLRVVTLGTLGPDSNAHVLDRVSPTPFYLDMRRATPAARDWLAVPRPTRGIGTAYPWPDAVHPARLSTGYDLLIHFPRITAARIR
ncbi:erythromycin esterase family protein [Streptomyces sp. NPDC087908]|uniref:erythromycin esterase family protein n=1 Tax=unclassified Streptomyces TaxID=2593676 RepID=UPI0011CE39A8|nr:erythromycin esterase family protein [Streptomyces sp. adm13(2018)]TXS04440.1 erythromycin esterase family protein [Streptomyces sp. adm13(2018)]